MKNYTSGGGEWINAYKILVVKPERRSLVMCRRIFEDNIKMDRK
jgi:hypothetical protein